MAGHLGVEQDELRHARVVGRQQARDGRPGVVRDHGILGESQRIDEGAQRARLAGEAEVGRGAPFARAEAGSVGQVAGEAARQAGRQRVVGRVAERPAVQEEQRWAAADAAMVDAVGTNVHGVHDGKAEQPRCHARHGQRAARRPNERRSRVAGGQRARCARATRGAGRGYSRGGKAAVCRPAPLRVRRGRLEGGRAGFVRAFEQAGKRSRSQATTWWKAIGAPLRSCVPAPKP